MKLKLYKYAMIVVGGVVTQILSPMTVYAASNSNSHATPSAGNLATTGSHTTPAVGTQAPIIHYAKTKMTISGHLTIDTVHIVSNDPWSGKATSWVPVFYLQEVLNSVRIQTKWVNGDNLYISYIPKKQKVNLAGTLISGSIPLGEMQFSIGSDVDGFLRSPKLVAKDPYSGVNTTYVPIYYASLFLQKRLFINSTWNGYQWKISLSN